MLPETGTILRGGPFVLTATERALELLALVFSASTAADALAAAGFQREGYSLTLNGAHTQLHERPDDGDILALTPKVDGGAC